MKIKRRMQLARFALFTPLTRKIAGGGLWVHCGRQGGGEAGGQEETQRREGRGDAADAVRSLRSLYSAHSQNRRGGGCG